MIAPCLECKERHLACWGICDRYKEWAAWRAEIKAKELAEKQLDSDIAAVKMSGMKRDGKQLYEK